MTLRNTASSIMQVMIFIWEVVIDNEHAFFCADKQEDTSLLTVNLKASITDI